MMNKSSRGQEITGLEVRLKMLGYPAEIYLRLRDTAEERDATNRNIIRSAVKNHLAEVLELCARAGFAPNEGDRKLVRTALDVDIIEELSEATKNSGLETTALIILCLRHELSLRLVDKERARLIKRLKRRLTRKKPTDSADADKT